MSRFIDLTHLLEDNTPTYPGDPPCHLVRTKSVEADGYTSFLLNTGLHGGTHLDAPLHFLAEGAMVKDLALDTFVGRGCLIDARGETIITLKSQYSSLVEAGDIVLLWTGHSTKYGTEEYYQRHPVLHDDLANFLITSGIKLIGFDLPSPDRMPFSLHKKFLGAGIPIMENLTNLEELEKVRDFEVIAFPLRICAEGSPVRVVAKML